VLNLEDSYCGQVWQLFQAKKLWRKRFCSWEKGVARNFPRKTCVLLLGELVFVVVELLRSQQVVSFPTYVGSPGREWKGLRDYEQ
jgi:hypothetical protein